MVKNNKRQTKLKKLLYIISAWYLDSEQQVENSAVDILKICYSHNLFYYLFDGW